MHSLFLAAILSLPFQSVKLLVARNAAVGSFICSVRGVEVADFSFLANPVREEENRENRNCYC